jgi:hypothetical protein
LAFDILTELNLDDIAKYAVVVAPTAACLTSSVLDALTKYVFNGGVLIADSEFGVYDVNMNRLKSTTAVELIGADIEGYAKYNPYDYFTFTPEAAGFADPGVEFVPAPLTAVEVDPRADTKVLAELCRPLAGRYAGKPEKGASPFILERRLGEGRVYYIAGTFFELYHTYSISHYKKLIADLIKKSVGLKYEILHATEAVEFTVRRDNDSGAVLVHLVNYTGGMSRPINSVAPLNGARLKVPAEIKTARSLVENRELRVENGMVELPPVKEYEVVVLTT